MFSYNRLPFLALTLPLQYSIFFALCLANHPSKLCQNMIYFHVCHLSLISELLGESTGSHAHACLVNYMEKYIRQLKHYACVPRHGFSGLLQFFFFSLQENAILKIVLGMLVDWILVEDKGGSNCSMQTFLEDESYCAWPPIFVNFLEAGNMFQHSSSFFLWALHHY